jgi:hypothetical protein
VRRELWIEFKGYPLIAKECHSPCRVCMRTLAGGRPELCCCCKTEVAVSNSFCPAWKAVVMCIASATHSSFLVGTLGKAGSGCELAKIPVCNNHYPHYGQCILLWWALDSTVLLSARYLAIDLAGGLTGSSYIRVILQGFHRHWDVPTAPPSPRQSVNYVIMMYLRTIVCLLAFYPCTSWSCVWWGSIVQSQWLNIVFVCLSVRMTVHTHTMA